MFIHNTHNNIIFIHIHEIYPHLIPQFDIYLRLTLNLENCTVHGY